MTQHLPEAILPDCLAQFPQQSLGILRADPLTAFAVLPSSFAVRGGKLHGRQAVLVGQTLPATAGNLFRLAELT